MFMVLYLFCRFSLGFFLGFQLGITGGPNAVTYRVRSVEPILGGKPIQVFQHGQRQPQVDSRNSHDVIVEASGCTCGRHKCAFATHRRAPGHRETIEGVA